jgi:hypothetical protein
MPFAPLHIFFSQQRTPYKAGSRSREQGAGSREHGTEHRAQSTEQSPASPPPPDHIHLLLRESGMPSATQCEFWFAHFGCGWCNFRAVKTRLGRQCISCCNRWRRQQVAWRDVTRGGMCTRAPRAPGIAIVVVVVVLPAVGRCCCWLVRSIVDC